VVRAQYRPLVIPFQGSWLGFAGSVRRDFGRRSLRGGSGSADDGHRDARSSSLAIAPGQARQTLALLREQRSGILRCAMSDESTTPDLVELSRRAVDAYDSGDLDDWMRFLSPDVVSRAVPLRRLDTRPSGAG
jgi:hypothetical protein